MNLLFFRFAGIFRSSREFAEPLSVLLAGAHGDARSWLFFSSSRHMHS